MQSIPDNLKPPFTDLLLAIADDKLMLGHRNSDWTGLGPILEEDIAFSSLAQDEIAHASAFYELAGELLGSSSDELAFGRTPEEYRCAAIVEVPDDFDWASAICRQFFCDEYDMLRLKRMTISNYTPLANLAGRILAEEQVHIEHSEEWVVRLGRGTHEARQRMQKAIDRLAPMALWLFEPFDGLKSLIDAGLYPGSDFDMYDTWTSRIQGILEKAELTMHVEIGEPDDKGGRRGVHTEHFEPLLNEMCEVYRIEPGVAW